MHAAYEQTCSNTEEKWMLLHSMTMCRAGSPAKLWEQTQADWQDVECLIHSCSLADAGLLCNHHATFIRAGCNGTSSLDAHCKAFRAVTDAQFSLPVRDHWQSLTCVGRLLAGQRGRHEQVPLLDAAHLHICTWSRPLAPANSLHTAISSSELRITRSPYDYELQA